MLNHQPLLQTGACKAIKLGM